VGDDFEACAKAGRDLSKSAVDCPYMPNLDPERRGAWLKGFSSTRGAVSASSDPAHAAGVLKPEDRAVARGNTPHAG